MLLKAIKKNYLRHLEYDYEYDYDYSWFFINKYWDIDVDNLFWERVYKRFFTLIF